MEINPFVNALEESSTLALNAKAKKLTAEGKKVFNLTLGEPDQRCDTTIELAMIKAINEGHHKYLPSNGLIALKQELAAFYGERWETKLNPDNFIISNGAKHSLFNTLYGKLPLGKSVIGCVTPYWLSYPALATMIGAEFRAIERKTILSSLEGLNCLILNFPSNPTGEVFRKEELKAIVEIFFKKNPNGFILSDEIYEFLTFEGEHASLGGEFLDKDIVIVNGFSKTFNMTGLRVGWAYYRDQLSVKKIGALQSHSTSHGSSIAQYGAVEALKLPKSYFEEIKAIYSHRAQKAVKNLATYLPKAKPTIPEGAFYLWVDVSGYGVSGKVFCEKSVNEAHVLAVPGDEFGCPKHIRFSIACLESYFEEALKKLSEIWI